METKNIELCLILAAADKFSLHLILLSPSFFVSYIQFCHHLFSNFSIT